MISQPVTERLFEFFSGAQAEYHIERIKKGLTEAKDDGDWYNEFRTLLDDVYFSLPGVQAKLRQRQTDLIKKISEGPPRASEWEEWIMEMSREAEILLGRRSAL